MCLRIRGVSLSEGPAIGLHASQMWAWAVLLMTEHRSNIIDCLTFFE